MVTTVLLATSTINYLDSYLSQYAHMRKITRVIPKLGSAASLDMENNICFSRRREVGSVKEDRPPTLPM
jgi:hypothetical protein